MEPYAIEMLHVTKTFPGIIANDDITLQLKKGEIHALLGENGAGKSTLMSVLFGLYQPETGEIHKNGKKIEIKNPNDANHLGIGMVHQHFKLVECFSVLDNIILGAEPTGGGFLKKHEARIKVQALAEKYGLHVDPDAQVENITVGMQQRTEILKMLYRDNEILIFDEPTAVLTPQEIQELMQIMRNLAAEGKSILFISHKLSEILAVADRCTVLRKGKYIGTVDTKDTTAEQLSSMMVGRHVNFQVEKSPMVTGDVVLDINRMTVASKHHKKNAVNHVSFQVHRGEIVCIAGIDGNGQTEFVHGLTGLEPLKEGTITLCGQDITNASIRKRSLLGMSHIPEDRHKHGLILDYTLEDNLVLQRYYQSQFTNKAGFLKRKNIRTYANKLIKQYDVRSGQGAGTLVRSMSGGNQQKAIIAREIDRNPELLVAVQPTRGLDVGAIEYIHKQLVAQRNAGKGVLLVSLELEEVLNLSDRILVMYEGEIVGQFDPQNVTQEELGLYMAGVRREDAEQKKASAVNIKSAIQNVGREDAEKENMSAVNTNPALQDCALLKNAGLQSFLVSLFCIILGLALGYVILLVINPTGAWEAITTIVKNFLYYPSKLAALKYLGSTLVKTAPLLMCSLSILFAYKAGLFNIGAAGQYVAGAGACLYLALNMHLPWYICMLGAMAAGTLWGAVSGMLKAYCNVNEVISCIMLNWIGLYLVNMLLTNVKEDTSPYTTALQSGNQGALLPALGLERFFSNNQYVTVAIPMAALVAVLIWIILEKTKFGYELKATGRNKDAARYCGMREKRNTILTMMISGGLAGLGASFLYLSGIEQWMCSQASIPAMGFNGIAASFLGGLNPIAAIFASYFIQHITSGGAYVDKTMYSAQISDLISAIIIYLCGFSLFFKYYFDHGIGKLGKSSSRINKPEVNNLEVSKSEISFESDKEEKGGGA